MAELRSSFGSLRNCLLTNEPEQEKPEPRTEVRALQTPVLPSRSKGVGQGRGGVARLYAVDTPRVHVESLCEESANTQRCFGCHSHCCQTCPEHRSPCFGVRSSHWLCFAALPPMNVEGNQLWGFCFGLRPTIKFAASQSRLPLEPPSETSAHSKPLAR